MAGKAGDGVQGLVYRQVLRKHLSLPESIACRGCLRRGRCKWFKAPPEPELVASVRHVGRLLFGMAQYARAHLQHPEAYPWYFTDVNLAAARVLMTAVERHTKENKGDFF